MCLSGSTSAFKQHSLIWCTIHSQICKCALPSQLGNKATPNHNIFTTMLHSWFEVLPLKNRLRSASSWSNVTADKTNIHLSKVHYLETLVLHVLLTQNPSHQFPPGAWIRSWQILKISFCIKWCAKPLLNTLLVTQVPAILHINNSCILYLFYIFTFESLFISFAHCGPKMELLFCPVYMAILTLIVLTWKLLIANKWEILSQS